MLLHSIHTIAAMFYADDVLLLMAAWDPKDLERRLFFQKTQG